MLAMDLLLDYLGHATEVWTGGMLPDPGEDANFDERRDYYENLSEGDLTFKQMLQRERLLLAAHSNYTPPDVSEPDIMTSRLMAILDQMSLMQKIQAARSDEE